MEKYPPDSDHDTLRKLFSKYGKVVHVSLPRNPNTREFKGFAFIEFSTVQAVEEVCLAKEQFKAMKKREWSTLRDRYLPYTKSLIVRLSNVPAELSKQEIKSMLEPIAPVGYIETDQQTSAGIIDVRYISTTHSKMVSEQFTLFPCHILTNEDEFQAWNKIVCAQKRKHSIDTTSEPSSKRRRKI